MNARVPRARARGSDVDARFSRSARRDSSRWAFLSFLLCALLALPRVAFADDPEISATVDTQRLGVGEILRLSVHVASTHGQPTHPSPGNTPGFTVVGNSSSPSQQVTITNGRMTSQRGLDVSWSLRAEKVGTWSVGPISVQVGGQSYRAGPVRIVVMPAGQAPPRANPDPFDPFGGSGSFDPFRNLLDSLNGQPSGRYPNDPKLAMDAPRGTVAFLHATADVTNVVVGQQVTVSMYLYSDPNARDPGMVDVHEATAADFVKRTLFEDDSSEHATSRAMVGDRPYNVRLLRKWALFPIKAGDLTVSPMDLTLQRNRATGDPTRESETLLIHVTEPPTEHRPPGYMLGDVGNFTLSADVTPRDIEEDGALGVTLTLSGTGNLPAMITPPAQAGIEWLPPEVHEKVGATQADHFGGSRTFAYVVRIHRAGDVSLGLIHIPFWDPSAKRYDVARANLGTVTVHPRTTPKAAADQAPDPFAALPEVRGQMGGTRAPAGHLAEDRPVLFWLLLSLTPLSFFAFAGIASTVKAVRERAEVRAASPETDLKAKVSAAERASRAEDARAISAATARVIEAATLTYAEVNVRDARGSEATQRLLDAGVDEALAKQVFGLLADCEAARFSPDAPPLSEARSRWGAAKETVKALRRNA
jgi:hypothetical protein